MGRHAKKIVVSVVKVVVVAYLHKGTNGTQFFLVLKLLYGSNFLAHGSNFLAHGSNFLKSYTYSRMVVTFFYCNLPNLQPHFYCDH